MEIIDAHTGLVFPGERHDQIRWPTFEARVAVLREAGVNHALACRNWRVDDCSYEEMVERNRRIASACGASEGFYLPSAHVGPDLPQACDLLRQCREEFGMHFVGEMMDRALGYQWGTPGYYRLLECAVELRMVPLIHCENEVAAEIGQRYPEGRFLIAHLSSHSVRWVEDRIAAVQPYTNLYLETSDGHMYGSGLLAVLAGLGVHRVLFGNDMGAFDPVLAVMAVRRSNLSEDDQAQVFAGNFHRLWEWTEGQS